MAHLYPDGMNLYGDIGNVRTLEQRARWRGIKVELAGVGAGPTDLADFDLIFFGGGQDRDQSRIFRDFADHKRDSLVRAVDEGAAVLAVCGGYQLLGHSYIDADGRVLDGLGLLDIRSTAGDDRWIGNVIVESQVSMGLTPHTIVGFENHGGRTILGGSLTPLGRVVVGGGNNGYDGGEGVVSGTVVGTYLHGSLLPKNPSRADWLLAAALAHRDGRPAVLEPLDDDLELVAHERAVAIAMAERGRRAEPRRR
ncbi:MAG: type 1 glutamine amidotransferase [Candidatus Dormibacteria bacterium]